MSEDFLPLEFGKKKAVLPPLPTTTNAMWSGRGRGGDGFRGRGGRGGGGRGGRGGGFSRGGGNDQMRFAGHKRSFQLPNDADGDQGARHFSMQMLLNPWAHWLPESSEAGAVVDERSERVIEPEHRLPLLATPSPAAAGGAAPLRSCLARIALDALHALGLSAGDPELATKLAHELE
jgi:hypothetical protein